MRCPKCNYPVLPKFDKCPKCGNPLKDNAPVAPAAKSDFDAPAAKPDSAAFDFDAPAVEKPRVEAPADGVSVISGKAVWSLGAGEIARRVTEREMAGLGAVKGVVVQDGVTAAVFSDGKLVQTLDGGIYRFSDEEVKPDGKRVTITPQGKERPVTAEKEKKEGGVMGFIKRLFGAGKEKKVGCKPEAKNGKPGTVTTSAAPPKPKPEIRNTSVVVVYLIANRVFEEVFGSAGTVDYTPFEVTSADGAALKVGVTMQMRVSDFETFRRQYLTDSNEVTVESLRRLMTPWVKQVLAHTIGTMNTGGGTLSAAQQQSVRETLGAMIQERLFGLAIINIFDLSTTSEEFDRLRSRERELGAAMREHEVQKREAEFRNRLADYEMEQEAAHLRRENDYGLDHDREQARYERELRELNRDNLLSEDEMKQFLSQHRLEMQLADAAREADGQKRRYETEKVLDELESQKLIDADAREAIAQRVATGKFERGQLNDILRHRALVETTIEKLRLDTDMAMQESKAKHQLDLNDLAQEAERTDAESLLYGKRYSLDRRRAEDALEMESVKLDADIENRRKEDAYAEERYRREREHEHDEWEEKFNRESREMERRRETRRADADLDFDLRRRDDEHEFEMTAKKAEFDFDLQETHAERQHARDMDMRRQQQEELRTKGDIAMRNMQMMMEAKRAARKDELDATTDQLNIKSQMTAEQIAAEQLRHLDASAQAGFMDALREEKSSAKEAEMARREAEMTRQMHEQMLGRADSMHEQNRSDMKEMMAQMMQMQQMSAQQAMDLARHSMDTSASIASARASAEATAAERRAADLERDNERYREDARHQQAREEVTTVPLNTAWLRGHGFEGSLNELAGQLSSLGAEITKDYDADGNPIIVVDRLAEGQVFDILRRFGVQF